LLYPQVTTSSVKTMTQQTDRELLKEIHRAWVMASDTGGVIHHLSGPMSRVAAALAQNEPVERPIWTEGVCGDGAAILKDGVMQPIESVIAALNAAELAQPEPEDDEIDEEAATVIPWLLEEAAQAADAGQPYAAGKLTLAAQLLGERRPATKPVPVAERPWERDGWCDAERKCWWGRPSEELCNSDWFLATRAEVEEFCDDCLPVVSLPHHALPLPQQPS